MDKNDPISSFLDQRLDDVGASPEEDLTTSADKVIENLLRTREIENNVALRQNSGTNAERQAEALRFSQQNRVPIGMAYRQLEDLKRQEIETTTEKMRHKYPVWGTMLTREEFGPIAQDPQFAGDLQFLEETLTGFSKDNSSLTGAAMRGYYEGQAQMAGMTKTDVMVEEERLRKRETAPVPPGLGPFAQMAYRSEMGMLKEAYTNPSEWRGMLEQTFTQAMKDEAKASEAAARYPRSKAMEDYDNTKGFLEPIAYILRNPYIALEWGAESLPASAPSIAGFAAAGPVGGGVMSARSELASAIKEELDSRGSQMNLDMTQPENVLRVWREQGEEILRKAETRAGVVGFFDALSFKASSIIGKSAKSSVLRLLGLEVAGVASDAAFGMAGEAAAEALTEDEIKFRNVLAEGVGEFPGGVAQTTLSLATEGTAIRAENNHKKLITLGDRIRNSKANKVSPETVLAHAAALDESGAVSGMEVPVEAIVKLFQDEGYTPDQIAENFPGLPEALDEAESGGATVKLRATDVVKMAQLKGWNEFAADIRVDSKTPSINELKQNAEDTKEFDDFVATFSEEEKKAAVNASLENDTAQQLIAAGREPREAQTNARLYVYSMANMADRLTKDGKPTTTEELMRQFPLKIVGADTIQLGNENVLAQEAQTPEFRKWFSESKVRDAEGKPLVVYHGTGADFTTFEPSMSGWYGEGMYFTDDPTLADEYALNSRDGQNIRPVYLKMNRPYIYREPTFRERVDGDEANFALIREILPKDQADQLIEKLRAEDGPAFGDEIQIALREMGHDGLIIESSSSPGSREYIVFDPTQIKSAVGNRGTFDPNDPNILFQGDAPTVDGQTKNTGNKHGFMPHLRVDAGVEVPSGKKPLFAQVTMNSTAPRQIAAIDEVLGRHPNATASVENWNAMMADALASADVPLPPYNFIKNLNGDGSQKLLSKLSQGQIADADQGFANAAAFRQSYINGRISIESTGKLFLWSFLSRGVSPYTQESLFIDSFDGIGQWIKAAADGTLKDRLPEYEAWAKSAAPQGSGQPGAGATHNLNAFGKLFLLKMSEGAGDGTGRSRLQVLHDMMSGPNATGKQIRRKFLEMGEGVGIDNKVVSFTLLVAGFDDLMVLDRVQIRELWNDGRFDGINLYDGYKVDGKPVAGSALSNLTYGARGLLIYEAIEQGLKAKISDLYASLGRPEAASVGRYHWETWVASSEQEASHATIDAILADAHGVTDPLGGVTAKEGEYGAYAYGARYGRDGLGQPYFLYSVPGVGDFRFTVEKFREFLAQIQVRANGVIPSKFKVTESGNGPWFNRKEVNLEKLGELAARIGERHDAGRLSDADAANGIDPPIPDRPSADQPGAAQNQGLNEGPQAGPSSSGQKLFQRGQSATSFARGSIEISPARDLFVVTLSGKANFSTFSHELGHYYLEVLQALVASGQATPQMVKDLQTIRDWMGLKEGEKIERRHHEMFARGWEAHLMEGRAPANELQGIYNRFRAWMVFVYKNLKNLNVELTDEVRGVMDRLVASDEAIAEARTQVGWGKPLPKEALYLSDEEYDRYVEAWNKANEAQQREIDAKLMLEAARETQAAWREERNQLLKEEQDKLAATRGHKAWKMLTEGKGLEDTGRTSLKIDPSTVPSEWRSDTQGMTEEGGLPLEAVAEFLGFKSGEEMLSTIAGAKAADKELPAKVKAMMDERHGALDSVALADLATQAVHSENTQDVLLTEFRAMASKAGLGKIPTGLTAWMAAQASQKVRALTRRQLDPSRWRRAELKAAQQSAAAAAKGDVTKAAVHKRQQLMASAMYRATINADKRIDTIRKKLLPFTKNDRRAKLGKAGDLYLDGIDEILEGVQLKKMSASDVMKLDRLDKLVKEASDSDEPLVLPDKLRAMLGKKNFADMTLEELEGVHDAVMNIWHLAKLKNELRAKNETRDLNSFLDEVEKTSTDFLGETRRPNPYTKTFIDRAKSAVRYVRAQWVKAEFLFGWLDGKETGGLAFKFMTNVIADARADYYKLWREHMTPVVEILRSRSADQKARWSAKYNFMGNTIVPGEAVTGEQIFMAALNLGNESNKRKLLEGYGWNEQQLMAEINRFMTKEDWDMAQKILDQINTLWPKIAAESKKATGLEPEKIAASPIVTPYGVYAGGYLPAVYDINHERSNVRPAKLADDGTFARDMFNPQVNNGMTLTRTDFASPLKLSIDVITNHLEETIHFVAFYNAVKQVDRIIRNPRFRNIVSKTMGMEFYNELRPWLKDIANNQAGSTKSDIGEKWFRHVRQGTSIAYLALNLLSALKQQTGVITALDAVKTKYMLSGIRKVYLSTNMKANIIEAFEKSKILKPLQDSYDRDLRIMFNEYKKNAATNYYHRGIELAMKPIALSQSLVNAAVWHGAFEESIEGGATEADAIAHADAIVRKTQGSGEIADLSPFQRGSEASKTMLAMGTYANLLYNRFENAFKGASIADTHKVVGRILLLTVAPSLAETLVRQLVNSVVPGDDNDLEDEPLVLQILLASVSTGLQAFPLVRDIYGMMESGFTPKVNESASVLIAAEKVTTSVGKLVATGEAPSKSDMKAIARGGAIAAKVPYKPIKYLIELLSEEDK